MEALIELDKELFLFLNGLGTPTWDGFWMFMTNKWSSIPLYLVLLVTSFRFLGKKHTLVLLLCVAAMIGATDQLANAFKYGFERLRPCHDESINSLMRLVKPYCGGQFGYFSAHASNAFATATFFSLLFTQRFRLGVWVILGLLVWSSLVAYSRIYIGVHFPLDVLTGMAIGGVLGSLFFRLYIFALTKLPK